MTKGLAVGVLVLVACQLGATRVEADWSGAGFVVGAVGGPPELVIVWNALGEAYRSYGDFSSWYRWTSADLPVTPAEIKLLVSAPFEGNATHYPTQAVLVTQSDAVWLLVKDEWAPPVQWRLMPPVPGGPVSVQGQSFGKTKAAHR